MPFAQERMGFKHPPKLFLRQDTQNANNPLGKTAYYDPQAKSVTLYITRRHPKDVMRSLSHELVHHKQNCDGNFDNVSEMGEGYAQKDSHLREMERQAYEMGNMCFRDWEDSIKNTTYFEHLQKGVNITMSTKDWKNKEVGTLLAEAWGFNFNLNEGKTEVKEEQELEEDIFAPNHYCVHHGGVERNGTIEMAEAVNHNYNEELGQVTHYDMKFADGTIVENVAFEDIQVTGASLAEEHKHAMGKRDDKDYTAKKEEPGEDKRKGAEKRGAEGTLAKTPGHGRVDYVKEEEELEEARPAVGDAETIEDDDRLVQEDSGEEEAWHQWKNEHADDDHIKEIERHLRALKGDRDYEEKEAEYDHDKYEDEGYDKMEEQVRRVVRKTIRKMYESKKNN